ncbi:glycosyltransferase family 4 protein [Paenibacillus thalictri]|uniref:Glycosyltransferase n=1 Tax=Paenibacillus thalictri TaxID=2527873 RepID=A0A4Q9DLN1_9BACL|nr:glycosyltransferase family 4 protein [Paenibacillus thalictri]TBL72430.1 glycosyltransferase [Paenibacillus thalictri]
MANIQVVWRGPVKRASGLGIASREYVSALRRQGVGVRVEVAGTGHWQKDGLKKTKVLIYHQLPERWDMKRDRKNFGRVILNTVWETTRIPRTWVPKINKFDAVCVPSLHNKTAMRQSGVKVPVHIVPHGVHTEIFKPGNKKYNLPAAKGRFVFVSVFGFQHRKNPETLLRAYWEQFSAADKVLLVIKTNGYAPYETGQWIRSRIESYKKKLGIRKSTAPIAVITGSMSAGQLKGIYTLGNAFVLPTRGEGVGLPFLESLSSGVPVIATGWGGHTDFLNGGNSFLINYKLQSPLTSMNSKHAIARPFRHLFSGAGQRWAEANVSSLKSLMKFAYLHPELCKKKGMKGRADMKRWSWNRAGAAFRKVLEMKKG